MEIVNSSSLQKKWRRTWSETLRASLCFFAFYTAIHLVGCTHSAPSRDELPPPRAVEAPPSSAIAAATAPQVALPVQNQVIAPNLPPALPPPPPMSPPTRAAQIGLILGPGGLKAFSHLGVLKEFEKANIQIHSIVGLEWGALIGALYASKARTNDVEWKLFKLKRENLPKEKMFKSSLPSETMDALSGFLTELFGNQTIEVGRLPFSCPTVEVNKNQIGWIRRGGLKDAMDHCMPYPPAFLPRKNYAAAPFEVETAARILREGGARVIVFVNVIGNNQSAVAREDHFESGITGQILWSQLRRHLAERRNTINYVIDVPSGDYDMMDFKDLRNMVSQGQAAAAQAMGPITNQLGM